MHLQDLIACIAILSIFYNEQGKIQGLFQADELLDMSSYDKVFTLNYFEFWDMNDLCIHLHGRIDYKTLIDDPDTVLIDEGHLGISTYQKALAQTRQQYNVQFVNVSGVVFAPDAISKSELICVQGIFPSNRLFLANDLYLPTPKKLYKEFDALEELDLFGVSPYGEKSLIDKINQKNYVRVFVYNKSKNEETMEWEKILSCPHELLDSKQI